MNILLKINRVFHTVKYMTPRQWRYRIYHTVRKKIKTRKPVLYKNEAIRIVPLSLDYKTRLRHDVSFETADAICNNEFNTISQIKIKFDKKIDWDLSNEGYRLVCFRLNSFRWLLDLSDAYKCSGNDKYLMKGFNLINDWTDRNSQIIDGDKWNAYVIAERIMNWIGFCSEYCSTMGEKTEHYAKLIYIQTAELSRSIEYQLGANHLLSEAKALLTAGAFLNDNYFYKTGKTILEKEFDIQFLEDGGHYERSVSYHIESLQQYFEAIAVMQIIGDADASIFSKKIIKAYQFLYGMILVNHKIPLVNDSAYDYPFPDAGGFISTADILYKTEISVNFQNDYYDRWRFVKRNDIRMELNKDDLYRYTGYFHKEIRVKGKQYSFFFDVGDCGPDSNLGHAHADALSILLVGKDKDYLVDSGVFTYKPSDERDECRSTRAHNTVEIDGKNSAEVWSAFRVARRGHSYIIDHSNHGSSFSVRASHDGYRYLKDPVIHTRMIQYESDLCQLTVEDELNGKGSHIAALRFHLGADCIITKQWDTGCLLDESIQIDCSVPIDIELCKIADDLGMIHETKCLVAGCRFRGGSQIKTKIKFLR